MPVLFSNASPSIPTTTPSSSGVVSSPTPTTQPTPTTGQAGVNRFERSATNATTLSPVVRNKAGVAVNAYAKKLRALFRHDAASAAAGRTPIRTTADLTPKVQGKVLDATKDFLMNMPVGALSPKATQELKGLLDSQGISSKNIEKKRLKDLGPVGAKLAKKWAGELKDSSPATFYGLLGAAGAAVGTYGFLQGSEALKQIGLKPSFETKLFGDSVKLRAEAMWDKRFQNPNAAADIEGRVKLSAGNLRARAHLDARQFGEKSTIGLSARMGDQSRYVEANVNANANGLKDASLRARTTWGANSSAALNLKLDNTPGDSEVSVSGRIQHGKFNVGAGARHNFSEDQTRLGLSANYSPTENLDISLRGSHDTEGKSHIGAGLSWRY